MRLVAGHPRVADWVASHFGEGLQVRGFGPCAAIGVIDAECDLVGGVVWNNWNPEERTIEMTAAATTPRWLTPRIVATLLSYPFGHLGCTAVIARTDVPEVLAWARRMGGDVVIVPNLGGAGVDRSICTLTHDAYLRSRIGARYGLNA